MFQKILVANRGEIACRIMRTLRRLDIRAVAVYSDADRHALHVETADEAVRLGPPPPAESYLRSERIIEAAKATGAQAIHPGYGFLSENPGFADACENAGLVFLGPTGEQMRNFGLKHAARELAVKQGVPVLPGSELLADAEHAAAEAARIGYPVMLKSTAGGGGIGMQVCAGPQELREKFESVRRLATANFKEAGIFLEKYIARARHIEAQIFGDGKGEVIALGERDCSTQRRNQKVIEETPAPNLPEGARRQILECAVRLAKAVSYRSAGTVEFVYDCDAQTFYFLEVNTRLQVEHCVTEEVFGIDLVEWMIRLGAGEDLRLREFHREPNGCAIEVRIYAEDPNKSFQPSCGLLTEVLFPEQARVDGWVAQGTEVTPYYDPLLAKLIVHQPTREAAIERMIEALRGTEIHGIEPNLSYLAQVLASSTFRAGQMTTRFLEDFAFSPNTIDVIEPGAQTLVQDLPGRLGYWAVGVPPSGPMDAKSFELANELVGNGKEAPGLEITMSGPTLRFNRDVVLALTGAPMKATLDGAAIPFWKPVRAAKGSTLKIRSLTGPGARAYLAVGGGLDVPAYLGSKSTFALGGFGGHGGRSLRSGDVLRLRTPHTGEPLWDGIAEIPDLSNEWEITVSYGPHGAPDFFQPEYIETFFSSEWKVHYHSDRTGVRLIGPKPLWARSDGGEAGLHPSNIHDNAYGIGSVDFTGDMPILLGPDGPSLGGFVCPAAIIRSELWKMGQLKAGDKVRFRRAPEDENPVLHEIPARDDRPRVVYRRSGDEYLLVEYGPLILDLDLRFRVHALMSWLEQKKLPGVIDLTPGIRSLQVHFTPEVLERSALLRLLIDAEEELPPAESMVVPARIVHLPLSWEDPEALKAIEKYSQTVRPDAPWCPSNIEFIRRINGLESIEDVQRIVFEASYLVLGLGDVYLGAPVATPLDPRHRLVTTKYNPARTWTPENAVGIGGAYLCVYGMEGPGGYQLFGRTVQMWNRFHSGEDFKPGTPWLLRFFDQIRFYPVSPAELLEIRDALLHGKHKLRIEETKFSLHSYHEFLNGIAAESAAFKASQQAAFQAERERWAAAPESKITDAELEPEEERVEQLPEGAMWVDATVPGNVWKILVEPGSPVSAGDRLLILSAMKMEVAIEAPEAGIVQQMLCQEGRAVNPGQHLLILQTTES